jgi:hypothetical protein
METIKTLFMTLVDVSGSMKCQFEREYGVSGSAPRANAIFDTIESISEVSRHNADIAVCLFGCSNVPVRDFITLLDHLETECDRRQLFPPLTGEPAFRERLIELCQSNGAPGIRRFLERRQIISDLLCEFFFLMLDHDRGLLRELVRMLPAVVTNPFLAAGTGFAATGLSAVPFAGVWYSGWEDGRADEHVKAAFTTIVNRHLDSLIQGASAGPPFQISNVQSTSRLLERFRARTPSLEGMGHGSRNGLLLGALTKYIYGRTPMCEALRHSFDVIQTHRAEYDQRILLVVSDGQSTDGDPVPFVESMRQNLNVVVVCCFITESGVIPSKQLFDAETRPFSRIDGFTQVFRMSSRVSTDLPAFAALRRLGWGLPPSGSCRMFAHVNNERQIHEFFGTLSELSRNGDALADVVHAVELDRLVGNDIRDFAARPQDADNCWLYAISAAIHLILNRIRQNHPTFEDIQVQLRALIAAREGIRATFEGRNTFETLELACPLFRMTVKSVSEQEARSAVLSKMPCVARFQLFPSQWTRFRAFFTDPATKDKVLKKADLGPTSWIPGENEEGHAVVLIQCSATYLTFLNSWGPTWGDAGGFRIESGADLGVSFFTVTPIRDGASGNVQDAENERYEAELAENALSSFTATALEELHGSHIQCPLCGQTAEARRYTGTILSTKCPQCQGTFPPKVVELIRSLYVRRR